MRFFWGIAVLVILIGLVFWAKDKKNILWWEFCISAAAALVMAAFFQYLSVIAQCRDKETISGRVVSATHYPWWQDKVRVEDYKTETYTTGSGKNRQTHTRRVHTGHHYEYHNHPEHWECEGYFGAYGGTETYSITKTFFDEICKNFCDGTPQETQPHKPNFYKGDKNVYVANNRNNYWYPLTKWMAFENRVKAGPSLYSFPPVPKDVKVFPYPANDDPFKSGRLLGTAAKTISTRELDILNGKLGAMKKVNIIMVGFGNVDSQMAHWLEAAWVGGKKNDLVLCYGGADPFHPTWSYVFGWTDRTIVKANLQTILIENPVDATILPKIAEEVAKNYAIKEWKDFSYLEVEPPDWAYWVYIIVLLLVQGGLWFWFHGNEFGGEGLTRSSGLRYGRSDFGSKLPWQK
jgi:hypothetical protein